MSIVVAKSFKKAVQRLFCLLRLEEYLNIVEIRDLLISRLGVSSSISPDDIKCSFSRVETISTRRIGSVRWYIIADCTRGRLPTDRPPGWALPTVELTDEMSLIVEQINENIQVATNPVPPTSITPDKADLELCSGFQSESVDLLFRQCFVFGPIRSLNLHDGVPDVLEIPCEVSTRKGVENLYFRRNGTGKWVFCEKSCTSQPVMPSSPYCKHCQSVRHLVRKLLFDLRQHYATTESLSRVERVSKQLISSVAARPHNISNLLQHIRDQADARLRILQEKNRVLQAQIDAASDSVAISRNSDSERIAEAFDIILPLIQLKYGEKSESTIVWQQILSGLREGGTPRYSTTAIHFGIQLASQTNADVYEKIRKLLSLPSRSHCKREQRKLVYGESGTYTSGFQSQSVERFARLARENDYYAGGSLPVTLAFDSMIIKKGIMISTRNADAGRLIGCVPVDSLSTLERNFEKYVQGVVSRTRNEGGDAFEDTVGQPFELNTEHFVVYARAHERGKDLSFICGAWNFPGCSKSGLVVVIQELMVRLADYDMDVRALVCDNAQANEGLFKLLASDTAADLLPEEWLRECGPEGAKIAGSFPIAGRNPATGNPVIFLSDPPHCVKRLAGALRNRDLVHKNSPMNARMLYEVWQAVEAANGGQESLIAERKFQHSDFIEGNGFSGMNVSSASRLFSSSMQRMVKRVISDSATFPLSDFISSTTDREKLFGPVLELMRRVERMFELTNGRDGNNMWLGFHGYNGEKFAREFLAILGWFLEWEREAQGLGEPSNFIAQETLKAVKYVCLGFSSLIYLECVKGKRRISPSKLNQDICEHHFANVRRNCQSHANPTETECMSGVLKSSWLRMESIRKGNCGPLTVDSTATVLKRESHHLRRQGYGKSKRQRINTGN